VPGTRGDTPLAADILNLMMRQSVAVVALGLLVGLGAALLTTGALSGYLFGIAPNDPLTLVTVVLVLAGVALLAGYVPARRATALDPVESMRSE